MKKVTYNTHPKLSQKGFQEKVKQTKEKIIAMKKVTYNTHPKLSQKGFQEKVKQTKEKIIAN